MLQCVCEIVGNQAGFHCKITEAVQLMYQVNRQHGCQWKSGGLLLMLTFG